MKQKKPQEASIGPSPLNSVPKSISELLGQKLVNDILLLAEALEPYEETYKDAGKSQSDLIAALLEANLLKEEDFLAQIGEKTYSAQLNAQARAREIGRTPEQINKAYRAIHKDIVNAIIWFSSSRPLLGVFLRESSRLVLINQVIATLNQERTSEVLKASEGGFGAELKAIRQYQTDRSPAQSEVFSWVFLARMLELRGAELDANGGETENWAEKADFAFLELTEEGDAFRQIGAYLTATLELGGPFEGVVHNFGSSAGQNLNPFELWSIDLRSEKEGAPLRIGISAHDGSLLAGQSSLFSMVKDLFKAYEIPHVYEQLRLYVYRFLIALKENQVLVPRHQLQEAQEAILESVEEVRVETAAVLDLDMRQESERETRPQIQGRIQVERDVALSILGNMEVEVDRNSNKIRYFNSNGKNMSYPIPREHGGRRTQPNAWRFIVKAFRVFEPENLEARGRLRSSFLAQLH